MIIERKLIKVWQSEVDISGLHVVAKEACVDQRTITDAIKRKKCGGSPYNKINAAILRLRNKRYADKIVKQLIEDDRN